MITALVGALTAAEVMTIAEVVGAVAAATASVAVAATTISNSRKERD